MGLMKFLLILLLGVAAITILVRLFYPLPSLEGRSVSHALDATANTVLGQAVAAGIAAHPGQSGVLSLLAGEDAFAARVLLARAATRSLDLQYYIWKNDLSGRLMFRELQAAADRGVRVRLLMDDNVTAGLDSVLAALNSHPNIEVRLFNPFMLRHPRWLGYLTDFSRLNRRMHNKSFTADNQASIVGGRNIGDEYLGAGPDFLFADLDVLAVGPVVTQVSRQFDAYWASQSAYPLERIVRKAAEGRLEELAADAARIIGSPEGRRYVDAIAESPLFAQLRQRTLPFVWAQTRLIADDPAKGLGLAADDQLLFPRLTDIIGRPESSAALISAYFVPTDQGVAALTAMAARGVDVSVLTNAQEATDVPVVHSGYAPWRKDLLQAGVRLYELRRTGHAPGFGRRLLDTAVSVGVGSGSGKGTAVGGAATALHAKTFSVDERLLFVGSFNFDPRSARLNTELGVVIDSPVLSHEIDAAFTQAIPDSAYAVKLDANGRLYWLEQRDGEVIRHDTEPGTSWMGRAFVALMAKLPIDWLL